MEVTFEKLSVASLSKVVEMVNDIFSDYVIPVKWDVFSFELDIRENSISLDDSFLMLVDDKEVGLCINCIRPPKARIDAFGILKEYRGHGYGMALLEYALDDLKWKNTNKTFLEVAQDDPAVSFYEKHGFRFNRFLVSYYLNEKVNETPWHLEDATAEEVYEMAVLNEKEKVRLPNWQREALSLKLSKERYNYQFVVEHGEKIGYVVWGVNSNGAYIIDTAPRGGKDYDRFLKKVIAYIQSELSPRSILIMNVPDNDSLYKACVSAGMKPFFNQLEMVKF
ncbi:GNAT family N-acetyltransferase [Mesoaciditoga lauensis]|uniref:GNAT family N-acetyltransferase n=1 Tax=Mesoaciditoga lauensis TaxID=1495039 RepID=UPI000565A39C|nr:GNAT family N-acetyltransferase [Mesoaciditoga lauensis]